MDRVRAKHGQCGTGFGVELWHGRTGLGQSSDRGGQG